MWFLLTGLIIIIVLVYITSKPKNFPPGPRCFPFIGCVLELGNLYKKFGSMAKVSHYLSLKYGPLVGLRMGFKNVVLINGFEAFYELHTREELSGKPNGISFTSRTWGKRLGLMYNDSDELKEQKSFVLQQFRKYRFRKEGMEQNISNEVRAVVDDIRKRASKNRIVRIENLVEPYIAKSLWFLLLGDRCELTKKELNEFLGMMKDFCQKISLVGNLFDYLPFLRHICPDYCGYTTYVDIHKNITSFIRRKIQHLKESNYQNYSPGFIDEYLKMLKGSKKKLGSSEDQLVAICLDLVIAGFETTYNAVYFAVFYFLMYPNVQRKAQEEIDRVVGRDKLPTLKDKSRLRYVDCVVWEILRLYSGRALTGPRRAMRDATFYGYTIPKDTTLLANFRGLHMDDTWENPRDFNPERYIKNGNVIVPENLIPFGLGKRRCPGDVFSLSYVFLIIASVLYQFNFKTVPNDPPSTDFVDGFVPSVKPFKAIVTLR